MSRVENGTTKYVVDFNKIFNHEDSGYQISNILANRIRAANVRPDFLVGHHLIKEMPLEHNAEYPLLETVAQILDLPYAKLYEHENKAGEFMIRRETPRGRVLFVDGALRTGNTLIRVAHYLRNQGIVIQNAVVIILRPEGNKLKDVKNRFKQENIRLEWLTTGREIAKSLRLSGYLDAQNYETIMKDEDFN